MGEMVDWFSTLGYGFRSYFSYAGSARNQAASTVFSWFYYQECWWSIHPEICAEHCQYVYKDI